MGISLNQLVLSFKPIKALDLLKSNSIIINKAREIA